MNVALRQLRAAIFVLGFVVLGLPLQAHAQLTPLVGVTPTELDFGCVPIGGHLDLTLQIFNETNDPASILRVTDVTVFGVNFSAAHIPNLPIAIPGDGSTITVPMRFAPSVQGPSDGLITIAADALNSPIEISLLGDTCEPQVPTEASCTFPREITIHPDATLVHRDWEDNVVTWTGQTVVVDFVDGALHIIDGGRHYTHDRYGQAPPSAKEFSAEQLAARLQVPRVQAIIAQHFGGDLGRARDAVRMWYAERLTLVQEAYALYPHLLEGGASPAEAAEQVALFLVQSPLVAHAEDWPNQDPLSTHRMLSLEYEGWKETNLSLTPHPRSRPQTPNHRSMSLDEACALATEIELFMGHAGCWYELRRGNEWINPVTREGS